MAWPPPPWPCCCFPGPARWRAHLGCGCGAVAILAATACVVMVTHRLQSVSQALRFWPFTCSGLPGLPPYSALLSWRIHPYGPSQQAIRTAYLRLAGISATMRAT